MKKTGKILSALYLVLILAFVYAPILLLFVYSFTASKTVGVWTGFTFANYENLFSIKDIRDVFINTFVLAFLAAAISTVLGTFGAIGIFYNRKWLGKIVKSASQIPVINAEIVTAISLALVFSVVGLGKSYAALLIGHIVLCAPFVVLAVLPKLKQMDGSLYEAALDLGATPAQALFKVVLPEILPGVFSGFMLAVTLSLDDYMITAYTKPASFESISTYVFGAIKKPQNAKLAELRAMSSVIFVIMIAVVLIINLKKKKQDDVKA